MPILYLFSEYLQNKREFLLQEKTYPADSLYLAQKITKSCSLLPGEFDGCPITCIFFSAKNASWCNIIQFSGTLLNSSGKIFSITISVVCLSSDNPVFLKNTSYISFFITRCFLLIALDIDSPKKEICISFVQPVTILEKSGVRQCLRTLKLRSALLEVKKVTSNSWGVIVLFNYFSTAVMLLSLITMGVCTALFKYWQIVLMNKVLIH